MGINIRNYAGDSVTFTQTNQKMTKCADCGAKLEVGRGVLRQVRRAAGTGWLCNTCAGETIVRWAKFSNTQPGYYHLHQFTMSLVPFDGVVAVYALPAAELAQAWHDHGAGGLALAAAELREQARAEFLTSRNIPIPQEKSIFAQVAA